MTILYSRGIKTYDAVPEIRECDSFDTFREAILADRGVHKGQQWIAAPFAAADESQCAKYDKAVLGKPHRSGYTALPRRWLGLDVDGGTQDAFVALKEKLAAFKALAYTTASHTLERPRIRIIVELAYPLDRDELKIVSAAVRSELSSAVLWDETCDRAEQPLYLPLLAALSWKFDGHPVDPWRYLPLPDLHAIAMRDRCYDEISAAVPGSRNNVLNKNAFLLGGLVGAGRLDYAESERLLVEATKDWANPRKTRATIRSALKRGSKEPLPRADAPAPTTVPALLAGEGPPSLPHLPPLSALNMLSPLNPSKVIIQRGDQVTPEPIDWLWRDWIARGKFHISAGAAGTGKTTTACALAATITSGGRWPDGTQATQGSVLMWSGEDDVSNVLAPRFMACNANMSKVHFVTGTTERGKQYSFDPSKDLHLLEEHLHVLSDVVLIIIDPIVSAVGGDSHKNTETRRALQPLVDLAAKFNCALIGITHLSKGTQGRDANERVTGSLAFVALARLVFQSAVAEQTEGGPQRRIFVRSKSNVGLNSGGFEYRLEFPHLVGFPGVTGSKVVWGQAIEGSARSLLTQLESCEAPSTARNDARAWLVDRLSAGPVPAQKLKAEAAAEGHSWPTLRRAKDAAHIRTHKLGNGPWVWRLPLRELPLSAQIGAQGAQDAQAQGVRALLGPPPLPPSPCP